MAVASIFHYHQGSSWIYRHHPLCRVAELCASALFLGLSSFCGVTGLFFFQLILFHISGISIFSVFKQLFGFKYLILIIGLGAWFSSEGKADHQALEMAETVVRFAGYILTGLFFTMTTRPSDVSRIVYRILKPVPAVNAAAVASFIQNVLAMIPAVFNSLDLVRTAVISRSGKGAGPFRNARFLSYGLLVNSFIYASAFSEALESRCSDQRMIFSLQKLTVADCIICCLYISVVVCLYGSETLFALIYSPAVL